MTHDEHHGHDHDGHDHDHEGHDHNTHGTPDGDMEADTASGGAPEPIGPDLTDGTGPDPDLDPDQQDVPPENPSGG